MTGLLASREPGSRIALSTLPRSAGGWRAHWPLSVIFLGLPLWWVLGLMTIVPIAMSVVMAVQLTRRKNLALPRGFALWALFLVWVALGVFVLWVDAPGAVPGGGPARLLVFLSRCAWYFAGTAVLLWVANLSETELPKAWVYQLLGVLFVVTAAGGLLGVFAPLLQFPSLVELLLPAGIRGNALVQSMVHPSAADIQDVLGRPGPRPKAPFAYSNSWGSVLALSLPFFLVAWFRDGRRWQRVLGPVVLVTASVPVVFSLNRGLWLCLFLGAVALLGLQIYRRRLAPLIVTAALLVGLGFAFVSSPLGTLFEERLNNQHSNERRGDLLVQTVTSAATGSPIVGFGSTRDVQGNFGSIAGGPTPDCSACGVPPLGTQGQLWGVIFSQGLLGAALFLLFFLYVFSRCWRCRTTAETLCTFVLFFFAVQLFVYDTLDVPILVVMIVIGVLCREQIASGRDSPVRGSVTAVLARPREVTPFLALLMVIGAALGSGVVALTPSAYAAKVRILPTELPVHLDAQGAASGGRATKWRTVDTEAALVVSGESLARVANGSSSAEVTALRDRISVTAPPNTSMLTIEVRESTAARADEVARQVASSYLTTRTEFLVARRDEALARARLRLDALWAPSQPSGVNGSTMAPLSGFAARIARSQVQDLIRRLALSSTSAGEVTSVRPAERVSKQAEVPITSGAGLGLLVGALIIAGRRGWHPPRLRGRIQSSPPRHVAFSPPAA